MPTFSLKLQQSYFKQGFVNVVVEFDSYVRETDGSVIEKLTA